MCVSAACTDSSGAPRAHGEVWKASKDACCMYRCDNDTIVPVEYNCSNIAEPVCHRVGEVIISLADDASCCPQRVCGEAMSFSLNQVASLVNSGAHFIFEKHLRNVMI